MLEHKEIDGFYVAYMSAQGYGVVLFAFQDGIIVGADAGGVKFDGIYKYNDDGAFSGKVSVSAPPNINLVQGKSTGSAGLTYEVELAFPQNFLEFPYLELATPFGPVNVKLERLRGFDK